MRGFLALGLQFITANQLQSVDVDADATLTSNLRAVPVRIDGHVVVVPDVGASLRAEVSRRFSDYWALGAPDALAGAFGTEAADCTLEARPRERGTSHGRLRAAAAPRPPFDEYFASERGFYERALELAPPEPWAGGAAFYGRVARVVRSLRGIPAAAGAPHSAAYSSSCRAPHGPASCRMSLGACPEMEAKNLSIASSCDAETPLGPSSQSVT